MFKSERVPCYLNSFSGHGDDPDNKELKLVFHVFTITPELATEISPFIADRLFRNVDGEMTQARELSKASFASIQVPMQNLTLYPYPEAQPREGAAMIPGAAISNLRSVRDPSSIRLEFDVVIPMDSLTMDLVEKYYKATCFITMEAIQREIEMTDEESDADEQGLLQDAADAEPEMVGVGAADGKSAAAGRDDDASDTSHINRPKGGKTKRKEAVH
jgi:hypothetical protein